MIIFTIEFYDGSKQSYDGVQFASFNLLEAIPLILTLQNVKCIMVTKS